MTKKVKTYSAEFKAEAVKKIDENEGNVSATARQIGVPMQTLSNWQKKAQAGKLKGTENYDPELIAALEEIKQLKRQLKTAEEERDILNEEGKSECLGDTRPDARRELCSSEATAYFAKVSK